MATARRCSGCGASLGEPTDDDLTVVCRFCGLRQLESETTRHNRKQITTHAVAIRYAYEVDGKPLDQEVRGGGSSPAISARSVAAGVAFRTRFR